MATYDLTSKSTAFVNQDTNSQYPSTYKSAEPKLLEAYLDIGALIRNGYTFAAGDVFQLLDIEANTLVLYAGAEVIVAFDGTTPTVDIDFAGGDDIIDGGDVSSTGFLAGGTNGTPNAIASTAFTQLVTTADTIDVLLNAGAADVTTGVLRVYAWVFDHKSPLVSRGTEVVRDQLA